MAFGPNNLISLCTCSAYVNMYVVLRLHHSDIISIGQMKSGRAGWDHRPRKAIGAGHSIMSPEILRGRTLNHRTSTKQLLCLQVLF